MTNPPGRRFAFLGLGCLALCLVSGATLAETPAVAPAAATSAQPAAAPADNPVDAFREVALLQLVPASRMTDGTRAIFAPQPVRFQAKLAQLPSPQKTDYLKQVMGMMGMTTVPVSQRVALDYGGDKLLAAYVEDQTAARIAKEIKVGDSRTFYAFHVYNNRQGPALVITSFGQ
ncbi:hypothetical protein AGMMS49545_01180 [Betaproteobacteria bacterium]|nr:hypothetical protein AGMMS49545_01180 [Betaproteobacteria bacterium]GHT90537.1 hypothetical protein FACS1894101_3110 [Betaproteobacteria bacterium]